MSGAMQEDLFGPSRLADVSAEGTPLWWKIRSLVDVSDAFFVKKLSRNDTSWAEDSGRHQAGFYVPRGIREAGFLPELKIENPDKPHIRLAWLDILWPQVGEATRSPVRHFSNKGSEAHVTRLPRALFRGLAPASLLMMGRLKKPLSECGWWIVVLDSSEEEAELLETVLDLGVDFHCDLFEPSRFRAGVLAARDELEELVDRFRAAIRNDAVEKLVAEFSSIPEPGVLAQQAREIWLVENGASSFSPWEIPCPGDAIMEVSREIEFRIYRRHELRRRAAELLKILLRERDIAAAVVRGYADIDAVLLSAGQQRKTRAGRSFENHIAEVLDAGGIRFVPQAVTGGRRPDFVMPSLKVLRRKERGYEDALVLSAKTTLRERWKQVSREKLNCDLYLATVDDRVSPASIAEMAEAGIWLVVPESLKASKEAFFAGHDSVITFRQFFDSEIQSRRPHLLKAAD